ncbi:MAG: hypothetical protein NZ951_05170 [Dehalococcoidia bacterium]|nr:hypothetical protein [Dehalococcoidia bacterium]MDW8119904.1 hypothetical protein [Chloroflexota bacterium]
MSSHLIPPVVFMWVLAFGARFAFGSWLAPGALAALAWAVFVTVSALVPDYQWMPTGGLWWIGINILTFCIGCGLALLLVRKRRGDSPAVPPQAFSSLEPILWILMGLAVVFIVLLLFVLPPTVAERSLPFRLLHGTPAASMIVGGCLFASATTLRQRIVALLPLLLGLALATLSSSRTANVINNLYWFLGFVYMQAMVGKRGIGISLARTALLLALAGITFLGATFATRQRYGRTEYPYAQGRVELLATVWRVEGIQGAVFKAWPALHTQAQSWAFTFTVWFDEGWANPPSLTWGRYFFDGPIRLLQGRWGTYSDLPARYENIEIAPGISANTATLFKYPILDFGFGGALVLMLLLGLIAGWAYRRLHEGNAAAFAIVVAVTFYFLLNIGPFVYNALTQAYLILALALWWAKRRWEREQGKVLRTQPQEIPTPAPTPSHV